MKSTTLEAYAVAGIVDPASFAWSPDGQVLAVSMPDRLMLVSPSDLGNPRVLKECQEYACSALAFSPDGQLLATNNHQGLTVLELATGKETLLSEVGIFFSGATPDSRDVISPLQAVAFSPDSQRVAYTSMGGIFVVPASGGEVRRLISPDDLGDDWYADRTMLQWSEDSTRLRFARHGFVGSLETPIDDSGTTVPKHSLITLETPIDGSGSGSGDQVALPPLPGGILPYRCMGTFQATGRGTITIASGVELDVVLEDLFLQFTGSEARVQMTESAFQGPRVAEASTSVARFRGDLMPSAWAPGPIRTPTLALSTSPMRGCAVIELQTMLANRGFDPGPIDGIYGPATEAAVRAFQQANNLAVDGIVGAHTWAALGGWKWGQ
ncbi:peptidoglycan-binding protein [Candidatus Chloroploca sp. M-50]|uniref:Peptidoglycan-binding protein n=1 Tax=Candidatus Chloroploca mongolica TaxID=2528176 RepID=A0ABS4DEU6_9CHLR|nr:peptidoglycan-binding protein [Candidatus Chloroploca mongolica]